MKFAIGFALLVAAVTGTAHAERIEFCRSWRIEDWFVEVSQYSRNAPLILSNYKLAYRPHPTGDRPYTVYFDSEEVTFSHEGGEKVFRGRSYQLRIAAGGTAKFYRRSANTGRWTVFEYNCN